MGHRSYRIYKVCWTNFFFFKKISGPDGNSLQGHLKINQKIGQKIITTFSILLCRLFCADFFVPKINSFSIVLKIW